MLSTPIKILLVIFCLLGIYSFLLTLSPKKSNGIFGNIKPIFTINMEPKPSMTPTPILSPSPAPKPTESSVPVNGVVSVNFDGKSFTPAIVTLKVGQKVIFKNISEKESLWVASDPHPVHDAYPELDSKKAIEPGGSYEFVAGKIGSWGYHDHIQPSIVGKLIISSQ